MDVSKIIKGLSTEKQVGMLCTIEPFAEPLVIKCGIYGSFPKPILKSSLSPAIIAYG